MASVMKKTVNNPRITYFICLDEDERNLLSLLFARNRCVPDYLREIRELSPENVEPLGDLMGSIFNQLRNPKETAGNF